MASVDSNNNSRLTLAGYCARVVLALAVVVIALKITLDHWPCQVARIAVCPSEPRDGARKWMDSYISSASLRWQR